MIKPPSPERVEAVLRLLRRSDNLEALPRTGYVISRVPNPESIAAHTWGVCLVANLLVDLILERDAPPALDRAAVLEMAMLHDIAEATTTDIPSPVKRFVGREVLKDGERRAAAALFEGLPGRYMALWSRCEDGACLESRVVHAADRIQMMVKVLQYEAAGLGDLRRFWAKGYNFNDAGLPEARALLERIQRYHDEGDWPPGF